MDIKLKYTVLDNVMKLSSSKIFNADRYSGNFASEMKYFSVFGK